MTFNPGDDPEEGATMCDAGSSSRADDAAELLGDEDRGLRVPVTVLELAVLCAARRYAEVLAEARGKPVGLLGSEMTGRVLAARDALALAAGRVGA